MSVPAARTFTSLKNQIRRYVKLKNDSEADTLAGDAVQAALISLASLPLKGLLATSDISLTATNNTVSLPADFSMPFSLHLLDTSNNRNGRIIYKGEEDFDYLVSDDDAEAGEPTLYTTRENDGDVIEFNKSPSAAFVTVNPKVRLRYFRRINTITTGTATFSIPPEFEEYIKWHGRQELAAIYNPDKFPLAQQKTSEARAQLIKRDTIRDLQDWT